MNVDAKRPTIHTNVTVPSSKNCLGPFTEEGEKAPQAKVDIAGSANRAQCTAHEPFLNFL